MYDAIVVSEVVEHVLDVPLFIQSCQKMAKPGASLFFSTINRTLLSRVVAVQLAEVTVKDDYNIICLSCSCWASYQKARIIGTNSLNRAS